MRQFLLRLASLKHLVQRPWQWLPLLLLGLPLAWSAGVSINNMVITTVKQLAFAQATAEVKVGAQFTQTATVRLSPGAVTYRSSNPQVASVNAQTGQVSGVLAGEATIFADQAAAPPYPAANASYAIRVRGESLSFNPWVLPSVQYSAQAMQITPPPTSNNPDGKTTYSVKDGNSAVLSITAGGLITMKGVGKATIVATQAPSGRFEGGSTQAELEIVPNTTQFTWPAQKAQLGQTLLLQNPTDSPNTGGSFSYTVKPDAQNRIIASVSGNVLTPLTTGSTTLTVTQAASGTYAAASLDVQLTVEPGVFTISGFTVNSPRTYDPVDPSANEFLLPKLAKPEGSSSEYVFSSEPAGILSIIGRTVTVLKPGTVTLTATLPRDPALHEAATATASLEILKATPQITLSRVDKLTGDPSFTIPVSSSNTGTPITLSLEGAVPPGFATLIPPSGPNGQWSASVSGVGTATLVAKQPSTDVFGEGSASVPFVVTAASLLKPNPLALADFAMLTSDTAAFKPAWTGAIGDPATIEVTSSATNVATVSPIDRQTITLTGLAGTTDITLRQPAQSGYQRAEVKARLTVTIGSFAITGLSDITRAYNPAANTFNLPTLTPPPGSASVIGFSSSDTSVATVNGQVVTVLKPGKTIITATLPQDPLRHRQSTATATLTVNKGIPVITVTDVKGLVTPPPGETWNNVPFTVTTNSDGRVIADLVNQMPRDVGLAYIDPPTQQRYVRIYKAGTATLLVTTLESDFFVQGQATAYFLATAEPAMPNTLALRDFEKFTNDSPFKPAWTDAVGNPATIEVSSSNLDVATVGSDKQTITLTGRAGTATIELRQAPQSGYEFARVSAQLTVRPAAFQITGLNDVTTTFNATDLSANQFVLPTLSRPPGATSEFSFSSSDTSVATVNTATRTVTILRPGKSTITATLPEDLTHQTATASMTLTVNKAIPRITLNNVEVVADDADFPIPVSSTNRDAPITLTLQNAQPPDFATVEFDAATQRWVARIQRVGSASLVATQAASGVYAEGSASATFNVRATALKPNTLALANFTKLINASPFKPEWTGAVGDASTIVVSSSNPDVATVSTTDKQTITLKGRAGTSEITLTQDVQNGYQPATVKATLTVNASAFQITGLSDIIQTFDAVKPEANQFVLPLLSKPQGSESSFSFSIADMQIATVDNASRTVTLHKPGATTITATLPEDPLRHAAASLTVKLTVNKALPAIGLSSVNKVVGDPDFKINVASNSPEPIALVLQNPQPPGFATLSQNASKEWVAHIAGAGSATIVATQGASASGVFDAGSASAAFMVTPTALLPNPLGLTAFDKLTTDAAFRPAWTNAVDPESIEVTVVNSGVAVATVDPTNKQIITLTGQPGTAEITLKQAASATHQAAEVKAVMTVRTGTAQAATLAFSPTSFTKTYGDSPFTPATSMINGTDVLPTFTSDNTQVASVDSTGRVISILGAGTARITATAISPNFATATAVAELTVNKRAANLAVNGTLLRAFANGPFDLPISTLSSGTLSVTSSNTGVASVALTPGSLPRVTPVGLGETNLHITQAEDANHLAAEIQPDPKLSIFGQQASITWNVPSEIVFNAGTPTVRLPAATTSNPTTAISYSASNSPAVGSLNGLDLTLTGTLGTITLTASQPGGNGYAPTQISTQVRVVSAASSAKANTTLTALGSIERNLADGAFTISYQTDSDAPVVLTILSGSAVVALDSSDPNGHRLVPKLAGEALLQLSQVATSTRNAPTPVRVAVLIKDSDPIYAFAPMELSYNVNAPVVDITPPQSRSVGEFSYSVVEGKNVVQVVGGNRLQMLTAGEATVLAVQKADGPYASDEATARVTVSPQASNLAFDTSAMSLDNQGRAHRWLSGPPTFLAKAASRNSIVPISYSSSRPSVASIDASTGLVTVRGLGETTLIASQAQGQTGFASAQAQLVLQVDDASSLSMAPFEVPLSQGQVVPPYVTNAPDRAVELSVDKPALASVAPDKRSLNLLGEGTVQVTVTHPATASQAAVSATATMTITAKVPLISVLPASIQHVWTGAEHKIVLTPSSNNPAGGWQLSSNNPAVASVNGLEVTLGAIGSTSLQLSQAAGAGWAVGSVTIPVQVTEPFAVTELNDMSRPYGSPNIDLPATLNGQAVGYTSLTPGVAEIVGTRSVKLNSVGSTQLQAKTAAGALIKEVRLTVTPGDPLLVMGNVNLASNAFGTTMKANSASSGKITYSIVSGDTDWVAEIRPTGELFVKGPGTVVVQAAQEAQGNYAGSTTTASVNIADGVPAVQLVQGPPPVLRRGESFEVRYRINFTMEGSEVHGGVFNLTAFGWSGDGNIEIVSQTPPSKIGDEGRITLKARDNAAFKGYRFALASVYSYSFNQSLSGRFNDPNFYRDFSVQGVEDAVYNLGQPITLVYGTTPVMPKTYDANGVEITDGRRCTLFTSSNPGVLGGVGIPSGSSAWPAGSWTTTGSGTTVIGCGGGPGYQGVLVTVLGADPLLQGFPSIEIGMDSTPYTLRPPTSRNSTGAWTYQIVQPPGEEPVARIVNGEIYPLRDGRAHVRATQAAASPYREASIETGLTVNPAAPKSFSAIVATYGDPDFAAPRPNGVAAGTSITYTIAPATVATVVNGMIHIEGAGTATVTATWREGSTDRTAQGQLTVLKAKPRLFFDLPPQVFGISACGADWTWPIANQGTNNSVGGRLITNSDGALYYPMGTIPGRGADNGPNPDGRYWFRSMGSGVYVESQAPWLPAWVEQAESANFLPARSETLYYGLWASSNAMYSETLQRWVTACNH